MRTDDDATPSGDVRRAEYRGPEPVPGNPLRALFSAALWRGCAHLATDAVAGLAGLGAILLLLIAVCLVPLALIGVPLGVTGGSLLFLLGDLERTRFAVTCRLYLPPVRRPDVTQSPGRASVALLTARATWRQAGYFVLLVPVACGTFVGVVLAWAMPLTLLFLPFYYRQLPSGRADVGPLTITNAGSAIAVAAVALLIGSLGTPLVVRALLAVDVFLARRLLAAPPREALTERVERLTESRARVLDAAEEERRRIERDLHDGAQQQLVAMQMTLGRLRSRMKSAGDAEGLALVDDARREARQAIGELRDLTRGLHPPVLTDRGLDAALSAIAARAPVPVTVDVQVEPRPSITIEAIAYFVVTEALTNVAKHAAAERAWVTIRRAGDRLLLTICDDGRGGATPEHGTGLAGLADRVAGVDGSLHVTSPAGGPTSIEVELPCDS
ncbi:MAG TPA: sensor domain-containing protein [Mycobacteriales bacterium]|nr:sensor domain-containing protein [Mycobacteriales bacterium]